jgi:hypothetical protein
VKVIEVKVIEVKVIEVKVIEVKGCTVNLSRIIPGRSMWRLARSEKLPGF